MAIATFVPDNSTSSKQDQLLIELQKKADLTETQPITGNVEACLTQYEYSGDLGSLDAQLNIADPCATGSAVFQVSGTWKGKIVVEGAVDGVYNNLSIVQPGGAIAFTGVNNDNQNGVYRVLIISGYTKLRLRMSSYTSGTASVIVNTNPLIATPFVWQLNAANLNATVTQGPAGSTPWPILFVDENGTSYGVKHIQNKPRFSSMPYLYDIAEGNVTGHTSFAKLGYNGDVGTSEEDIWGIGGTYVFPVAAQQMEVVSTSVEDDILTAGAVAGTGVHKVKIGYLDNTYASQTEEVTLNGTSAVLTVAENILRVNSIRVSVTGTGLKAAGLITIRNKTDHTTVYRSIPAGLTRGREMVYTVPLGKTLYITSIAVSSGYSTVGKNVKWTARANLDDVNMTVLPVGLMMPYFEIQTQDSSFFREFEIPLKVPATCDIKLSAISDSANSVCTAAIRGWTE